MKLQIGRLIGRYPWIFLISSLISVLPFLSFFVFKQVRLETDIRRGFAPKNGRAMEEFKAFLNYRSNVDNVELAVVLVEAPEGKDKMLVNLELVQELESLVKEVDAINISYGINASEITVKDVRGKSNYLFEIFMQMFQAKNDGLFSDEFIQLRFPVCEVMGNKFNMGGHFFGVDQYPESEWSKHESSIKSIEAIAIWYIFDIPSNDTTRMDIVKKLLIKLFDKSKNPPSHNLFRYHIYADKVANEEMSRGSKETVNLLIFGLLLMLAFMCISMWSLNLSTKLILIPAAVLTPLLAAVTTFGLIGWCGYAYNSIMAVAPFLLLGIGVDDAFLLLHCWRKYRKVKGYSVENEMGLVVSEVGPSILITSVTNCMAFGVGFFAPSEALSSFCLCTSIAVLIDFIFEFTIFAACLSIISKKSHNENLSAPLAIDSNPTKDNKTLLPISTPFNKSQKSRKSTTLMNYCKFVTSKKGKFLALTIVVILYISSFFGLMKMKTTFAPQKTFPLNSRLQSSMKIIEKVLEQYSPINFVVNNPPNITDPVDYQNFLKFVEEMEALPETYGPDWTQLFLRDYISFDKSLYSKTDILNDTLTYNPTFENLEKYVEERGIAGMKVFNYHENPLKVKSFLFVIVCHGKRSWHDRAYFIEKIRAITDKYSQYKVTVFDYDATIFDLIITVKWEMMKAVLITLICMSVVCFIIIPSIFYTGMALLSIISIAFTLVGVLGWWGSDLDPVTMINVLMAIGFSVDFCAHVCYHYFKYCTKTFDAVPKSTWDYQRLYLIMNSVGRPTLEAATSTMICMIPLFFIDVYIVQCFAKTVVCVGTLGILHGLFLIPVALSSKDSFSISKESGSAKSLISTVETESAETNQML